MRLRVIPVLGTSPSMFGQAMSSYVLCSLAGASEIGPALDALFKLMSIPLEFES